MLLMIGEIHLPSHQLDHWNGKVQLFDWLDEDNAKIETTTKEICDCFDWLKDHGNSC